MASKIKVLGLAIAGAILLASTVLFSRPVQLAYWQATGQAPFLTFAEAMQAEGNTSLQVETERRIEASARVVETDGTLAHVQTYLGTFWVPARDKGSMYLALAEQERDVYGKVPAGAVVLDCGSHVGVYSRRALREGAAKVIAVEPVPETIECLRRNFKKEISEGRLIVYPKGVWNENSTLSLRVSAASSAANTFTRDVQSQSTIALPVTTVDNIVAELGLARVDVIKMDIEGAERQALAGARNTILSFHPRLEICTYHLADDPAVITATIASYGLYRQTHGSLLTTSGLLHEVTHAYPASH